MATNENHFYVFCEHPTSAGCQTICPHFYKRWQFIMHNALQCWSLTMAHIHYHQQRCFDLLLKIYPRAWIYFKNTSWQEVSSVSPKLCYQIIYWLLAITNTTTLNKECHWVQMTVSLGLSFCTPAVPSSNVDLRQQQKSLIQVKSHNWKRC